MFTERVLLYYYVCCSSLELNLNRLAPKELWVEFSLSESVAYPVLL
jgi:hypothetical protein